MQEVKSVRNADVKGKRVLVRCDLDVLDGTQVIDARLCAAIPTLKLLRGKEAAQIVIVGYVGRPGGKVVEELRVAPVAKRLHELAPGVNFEVKENLRFDPREESNEEGFAKELAGLGDIFVNESFATAHRPYASIVGIPKLLPSYAGLQFMSEVEHLSHALTPSPGSIALIAVTKADKIPLINKLATLYDKVLVGGPVPSDYAPLAPNIVLPVDGIPELKGLLDIGPRTRAAWVQEVAQAPFVLWNGPLGWYEKGYRESTDAIAEKIISSGVGAVIGGGDTINALKKFKFDPAKVFLSTGGGAMLQFLVDGTLPGIEALRQN
ncbi:MAG: phosphoglycerate kinase [bacterium]|nr:phosphoglycerate kinase [bacterium]